MASFQLEVDDLDHIPEFDGNPQKLLNFVNIIKREKALSCADNNNFKQFNENLLLEESLNRLTDKAKFIRLSKNINTIEEFINSLEKYFKDKRSVEELKDELFKTKMKYNEHPIDFLNRIEKIRNLLISRYHFDQMEKEIVNLDSLLLRHILANLPMQVSNNLKSKNHKLKNLFDARFLLKNENPQIFKKPKLVYQSDRFLGDDVEVQSKNKQELQNSDFVQHPIIRMDMRTNTNPTDEIAIENRLPIVTNEKLQLKNKENEYEEKNKDMKLEPKMTIKKLNNKEMNNKETYSNSKLETETTNKKLKLTNKENKNEEKITYVELESKMAIKNLNNKETNIKETNSNLKFETETTSKKLKLTNKENKNEEKITFMKLEPKKTTKELNNKENQNKDVKSEIKLETETRDGKFEIKKLDNKGKNVELKLETSNIILNEKNKQNIKPMKKFLVYKIIKKKYNDLIKNKIKFKNKGSKDKDEIYLWMLKPDGLPPVNGEIYPWLLKPDEKK